MTNNANPFSSFIILTTSNKKINATIGTWLFKFVLLAYYNYETFLFSRKVKSHVALALIRDHFYPCLILRPARDGFVVFCFHYKEELEVPTSSMIGNLKHLLNCEVSYITEEGTCNVGMVVNMDSSGENGEPMNFFLRTTKSCVWVSVPYIFMTISQAKTLL